MALCCWGAQHIHFKGSRSSTSSILNEVSNTTVPIVVDDVSSPHQVEELAVQLTSRASHSTMKAGSKLSTPRTSIITTANHHFTESDR